MTRTENPIDRRSPAELRAAFIGLIHRFEAVEHIGRHNRLFGPRQKIAEQLIAAGGNSERELLPLLENGSLAVRYTAAYDVKPFDRARFEAVLTALAESGGEIGRKARSSLEWAKRQDAQPPSPLGPEEADRRRVGQLLAWPASNPPPPGLDRAQLEGLIRARFPERLLSAIMALARPAIGLRPSGGTAAAPLTTRLGGPPFAA